MKWPIGSVNSGLMNVGFMNSIIITMMGGTITVESEFGKGSTFRFVIPAVSKTEVIPEAPRRNDGAEIPCSRAVVMVIDDEAPSDEFTEQIGTPKAQAGGWRGFWARWGG